jgi:hypothetical protein
MAVKNCFRWASRYMHVILALERLTQEDCNFEASLGYIVRSCLKKTIMRFYDFIVWPAKPKIFIGYKYNLYCIRLY